MMGFRWKTTVAGLRRRTTIVGFRRTTAVKKENDRGWETRIIKINNSGGLLKE